MDQQTQRPDSENLGLMLWEMFYNSQKHWMTPWTSWTKLTELVPFTWVSVPVLTTHTDWSNTQKLSWEFTMTRTGKMTKIIQEEKEWSGKHTTMTGAVLPTISHPAMARLHPNLSGGKLPREVKLETLKLSWWTSPTTTFTPCIPTQSQPLQDTQDLQSELI